MRDAWRADGAPWGVAGSLAFKHRGGARRPGVAVAFPDLRRCRGLPDASVRSATMSEPTRVLIELGKKKRAVAVAFDWPGWDRSAKSRSEEDALRALEAYRRRYASVAAVAGLGDEFDATAGLEVVERLDGIGMTDYYGMSGRWLESEEQSPTPAELERKLALLRAAWATFDGVADRVSPELRKGPRGGGRERDEIVNHANGAEIFEFAPKVGVRVPLETRRDRVALHAYREAFLSGIRHTAARGATAGRWPLAFLIRRCAWHMLDHAWEMEDRDLSTAG